MARPSEFHWLSGSPAGSLFHLALDLPAKWFQMPLRQTGLLRTELRVGPVFGLERSGEESALKLAKKAKVAPGSELALALE